MAPSPLPSPIRVFGLVGAVRSSQLRSTARSPQGSVGDARGTSDPLEGRFYSCRVVHQMSHILSPFRKAGPPEVEVGSLEVEAGTPEDEVGTPVLQNTFGI